MLLFSIRTKCVIMTLTVLRLMRLHVCFFALLTFTREFHETSFWLSNEMRILHLFYVTRYR